MFHVYDIIEDVMNEVHRIHDNILHKAFGKVSIGNKPRKQKIINVEISNLDEDDTG